jgi:lysozyme family protein
LTPDGVERKLDRLMADFDACIPYVLQNEDAGLTGRVTRDSGGLTRWGICQRSYPAEDIANLSLERAKEIYRRDFWERHRLDQLTSNTIAAKVLDNVVNMGGFGIKMLQRAVNRVESGTTVAEDGGMGPVTIAAANACTPDALLAAICDCDEARYRGLVAARPEWGIYLNGWLNRARKKPNLQQTPASSAAGAP